MGRHKRNNVYKYFEVDKAATKSKCLVCNKLLTGIGGSNLLKHLKIHKKEYEEIIKLNSQQNVSSKSSSTVEKLIKECTNLVTVHGRPLALLDDEAFQNILSLIPDCNVRINSRTIKTEIVDTAAKSRLEIAKKLMNKMLSIKIDIASLSHRSFMGINAQYVENGSIILNNLAMIELLERHTSEHLKEQVLYVLQRFRIDLEHVYSFTTDNGANMLKLGRLMNEQINAQHQEARNDSFDSIAGPSHATECENDISMDCSGDIEICSVDSDLDYDADTWFDTDKEEEYTECVTSSLMLQFHENTIESRQICVVRCAAHTLQLAVIEVIGNNEIKEIIGIARTASKLLRTQIYAAEITKAGKNQAVLDCVTRWNSTIAMLDRLSQLRTFCEESQNQNLKLTDDIWTTIDDLIKSLLPAKTLSMILQQDQLTIGDFYIQWLLCKIKLNNINTILSKMLHKAMENREAALFNIDAFLCAVSLDPRVNSLLSDLQRKNARMKLTTLYQHLTNLDPDKENESGLNSSSSQQIQLDSARQELDNLLGIKYVEAQSDPNSLLTFTPTLDVDKELEEFSKEPLLKSTSNILHYWFTNKNKYPRLHKVACVALATPATQVSVERLFSSLKFVVNKYRLNLNRNLIEDIIFIRNNKLYNKNHL